VKIKILEDIDPVHNIVAGTVHEAKRGKTNEPAYYIEVGHSFAIAIFPEECIEILSTQDKIDDLESEIAVLEEEIGRATKEIVRKKLQIHELQRGENGKGD